MINYTATVLALSKSLLKRYLRDKTALFFNFIFPLIFLFVFESIFSGDTSPSFMVDLTNNSETDFAGQFVDQLDEGEVFEISQSDDFETAKEKLGRGEYEAIIELPEGFGVFDDQGRPQG